MYMEDCMHHVLGLGAVKLSFQTKAENLFDHEVTEELFYLTQSHPS